MSSPFPAAREQATPSSDELRDVIAECLYDAANENEDGPGGGLPYWQEFTDGWVMGPVRECVAAALAAREAEVRRKVADEIAALIRGFYDGPEQTDQRHALEDAETSIRLVADSLNHAVRLREAVPGDPSAGPFPASVEEVADEVVAWIQEMDKGPAPELARRVAAQLVGGA